MMAWAVAERRTTATTRACDDWLTRGPGPLPESVKARRGDVQLESGWVHIRGTEWTFAPRQSSEKSAQGRNRTTDTGSFSPRRGVANSARFKEKA